MVKIWSLNTATGEWEGTQQEFQHGDWVRDVAWAPRIGLPKETIAVASESGEVVAWSRESAQGQWKRVVVNKFEVRPRIYTLSLASTFWSKYSFLVL